MSTFLGAISSTVLLSTKDYNAAKLAFSWLIGSLQQRGWDYVTVAAIPILAGIVLSCFHSRDLNLLLTGEDAAQALGLDLMRSRLILLGLISLLTGTAVSMSGGIAFVGLMVPHILRKVVGPDYRVLLPSCALGGAIFLVLADTLARLVIQPAEIQVGILSGLIGAPFFIVLVWTRQRNLHA